MTMTDYPQRKETAQSLVEYALVLPLILVMSLGIIELGRLIFMFNEVNNASREAARYGAAIGTGATGDADFLDCDEIRNAARDVTIFSRLNDDDIEIAYERDNGAGGLGIFAHCGDAGLGVDDITLGDRVVITVTARITPILSILPLPPLQPSLRTARTILIDIPVGPPECRDGVDNDGDGNTDFPDDDGCSSADDSIEAICYRLAVSANPPDGGSVAINPSPNCANQYIEQTDVILNAAADPRYEFTGWSGDVVSTSLPVESEILTDTNIIANFRLLETDLAVSKSDELDPVLYNEDIEYDIRVRNFGPDNATAIVVTDTLDAQTSFVSAPSDCVHSGEATGGTIVCTIDALANGDIQSFRIRATAPGFPTTVTNNVVVSGLEHDPNDLNNSASESTTIIYDADVQIAGLTLPPDPITTGSPMTVTVSVANGGPGSASNVTLNVQIPAGATYVGSPNPDCGPSGGSVVCTGGAVGQGGNLDFQFTLAAPDDPGTITLDVYVAANELDPDPTNNSAIFFATIVEGSSDDG